MARNFMQGLISRIVTIVVTSLLFFALLKSSYAETLRCDIENKFGCNQKGCIDMTEGSKDDKFHILIDTTASLYLRCEKQNCKTYPVSFLSSGLWLVANPTITTVFKMVKEDSNEALSNLLGIDPLKKGDFVDFSTLNYYTFITYGKCRP